MTNNQHTPGPWVPENNQRWGPSVRTNQRYRDPMGEMQDGWVAYSLQSMADARLIAAAPQLLEALERIVAALDNYDSCPVCYSENADDDPEAHDEDCPMWIASEILASLEVRAAINAAKGVTDVCRYCEREIVKQDGSWIDPNATGDDIVWRETCDSHDTFEAEHVPAIRAVS